MREEQFFSYLKGACPGRKYRVSGAELERALNLSGTDLRRLVNRLRRKGIPIASDRHGYFYAVTAGEVYTTIRQLKQMEAGLEKAIAGLEASLDKFGEGE
ncbi:HTH domain-containing protein [Pseudoflavonifractor sp. 60]|uniref:HTH domain-containing protein n=1 Tax=Pseudoflavonifractor sp. 60 TaxID=2304576 RepID=UPI00136EB698|nr:HTH domain-containing protein [Pseudoflavonifractor sp. 60]NBI65958.1 HTH domain-containing protein [Pseudoflavonifractor sp. 60]